MHGELPKQIWAKAKARTRRNLAIALIVVAVAAALVYVFTKSPPQQNRGRFGAEGGRCRCWSPPRPRPTCRSISMPSAPSRRSTP